MVTNVRTYDQPAVADRGVSEAHYGEPSPVHRTHVFHPHWGAIFAGLFIALGTLTLLSALGAAVGASAYDPGDAPRSYAMGSGAWAVLCALIAFFIGGFVAARASGHTDRKNGLFQGLLVWAVAITLIGSLVGTGLARASVADTRAALTPNPVTRTTDDVTPAQARRAAAEIAWGTFVSLLLGLGAALIGGHFGARGFPTTRDLAPSSTAPRA